VSRFVDRGAITAAYVGIGMAVVIGISFLLVIPIEPIYWVLSLPAGLLIGYYANARSERATGPWTRILANGLFAGLVTAATMAVLLLGVKALFFFADNGYRDASLGAPLECGSGPDCVYARYLADGRGADLEAAGVTDVDSFTAFYWGQQASTVGTVFALTLLGGLGGAIVYGIARPKPSRSAPTPQAGQVG
jgi:hypothetical protein